ncbi:MAG TPA: hypothetical protein VE621_22960 [Bryobacteraceae bacterium]|nr:hypothetical protein [Bryobacteraceae bacterium]
MNEANGRQGMDPGVTAVVCVRDARSRLKAAKESLKHPGPESLERCCEALDSAIAVLRAVPGPVPGDTSSILQGELLCLRRELSAVQELMRQAAELYFGWATMLSVAAGGYNPGGEPVPVSAGGSVYVEG